MVKQSKRITALCQLPNIDIKAVFCVKPEIFGIFIPEFLLVCRLLREIRFNPHYS